MMMAILTIIISLAVVLYAAAVIFKRRYKTRAEEIRNQVEGIEKASLDADFANLSRMTLSGDSLTEVENMDKSYHYLMNRRLPEIIEELDEIDEQLEGYHVFLAKTGLETTRKKTTDAISQYRELSAKVSRIKKQAESHQEAVTELRDKYQRIRKILLTKNFSYGQSIDALESSMQNLESLFEDYMKVLETGDLKKTDEILTELRQKTCVLETALDKIPPIYKNYKNVYPEQMTEIREAVKKMKKERYGFEFDPEKIISDTDDQIKRLDEELAKIEVENCESLDNKIYDNIEK
ncbi:septation ring formation regulator EzrA, partial [Ligilactobacillus sp.]|uniref:septation ring formation regulator EzrA n=1 Tax=Ligilactobacillus sp. TaxID=2767921 RepID=UPI002FE3A887